MPLDMTKTVKQLGSLLLAKSYFNHMFLKLTDRLTAHHFIFQTDQL